MATVLAKVNRDEVVTADWKFTGDLGFFNKAPISQPSGAAQAAVPTTPSATSQYGFSQAQADALVATVNAMRLALVNLGLIKGSA